MKKLLGLLFVVILFVSMLSSTVFAYGTFDEAVPLSSLPLNGTVFVFDQDVDVPANSESQNLNEKCKLLVNTSSTSRRLNRGQTFKLKNVIVDKYLLIFTLESNSIRSISCMYKMIDSPLFKKKYVSLLEFQIAAITNNQYPYKYFGSIAYHPLELNSFKSSDEKVIGYYPKKGVQGKVLEIHKDYENDQIKVTYSPVIVIASIDENSKVIDGSIDYSSAQRVNPMNGKTMSNYTGPLWGGLNGKFWSYPMPDGDGGKLTYKDGTYDFGRWEKGNLAPAAMD